MIDTKEIGAKGEDSAVDFFTGQGKYILLERNYRFKRGEIDIILMDHVNDQMVFVEVKTRANNTYGEPEEFVSPRQVDSILSVAEQYTFENDWHGMIRFDIVSINLTTGELHHQIDAFG